MLPLDGSRRVLVVVATAREARPVFDAVGATQPEMPEPWRVSPLTDRVDLLISGVAKANAAGATARFINPDRHAGAISAGVCGALPEWPQDADPVGRVIAATASVFADDGIITPSRYESCRDMGFPLAPDGSDGVTPDPDWLDALEAICDLAAPIATVSTCSGTDAAAAEVARRTGAIAEAMEGAAVGLVLARIDPSLRFAEVRAVSNTTGHRGDQRWDLGPALARLGEVLGRLL